MIPTQYVHIQSWAGVCAIPCRVVSQGDRYAKVKLLADLHLGRQMYPADSIKIRVLISAIAPEPRAGAEVLPKHEYLVSVRGSTLQVGDWVVFASCECIEGQLREVPLEVVELKTGSLLARPLGFEKPIVADFCRYFVKVEHPSLTPVCLGQLTEDTTFVFVGGSPRGLHIVTEQHPESSETMARNEHCPPFKGPQPFSKEEKVYSLGRMTPESSDYHLALNLKGHT